MLKLFKYFCIVCLPLLSGVCKAQNYLIELTVTDSLNTVVNDAYVRFTTTGSTSYSYQTNTYGKVTANLPTGVYVLEINHSTYKPFQKNIALTKNLQEVVHLSFEGNQLQEIVITAQENKGLVTSSKIDRQAMAHLQPSSFTDLLELLPGGKAKDPNLTSNNAITIREYGQPSSQYNSNSLGVQFMMDGNPMNSAADMQQSAYADHMVASATTVTSRQTSATGIDMRTISTNDIENVEIIRGIPSASYGDLTSGLVLINRKSGETNWQSRLKIDGFSKLYYLAKGYQLTKNWDLNTSIDYLDAKADPRNTNENYKRFSGSVRSNARLQLGAHTLKWKTNVDYNLSIDDETVDPDSGYAKVDAYTNKKQAVSLVNNLDLKLRNGFFNRIQLNTSIRQGYEDLNQTKLTQLGGPTAISIAVTPGVNDGYFPELTYVSYLKTEGRPLDMSYKLIADASFFTGKIAHNLETGFDFKYSKNKGRGQMYDLLTPPFRSMSVRPRPFNNIPAHQNLAFFIGDKMQYDFETHGFMLYAGARISKMLGMPDKYALADKVYVEPRVNLQWNAPGITIAGNELKTDVTLGYGSLYKQPTILMLYPNLRYYDFQQLNFYHNNLDLRYVNFMTYALDVTNYDLLAAKNVKKEIRLDLTYKKHDFFITYFDEDMKTGFRSQDRFTTFYYNRYDASGLDIDNMTQQPDINDLPYEVQNNISRYSMQENGSRTHKKGIEFGYQSPRFKEINTRLTVNGAWFKTFYENTTPVHEKPSQSINGSPFPFVGIYANDLGYVNSGLNYNAIIDTYLPNLDMNISLSLQGTIFSTAKRAKRIAEPVAYYDKDGTVYEFTEADKTDLYKQWLVRNVSTTDNIASKYTFDVVANLKATKRIYNNLKASLFVNRLFSYYQPYYFNDTKIERNLWNEPYFGMELTLNF